MTKTTYPITAIQKACIVTIGMLTNVEMIAAATKTTESQNVHADGVCMTSPRF